MKRLLAFLFLFIYLLNHAAYALPVFNSADNSYEFKKKCKYGRKDKLIKIPSSGKTNLSDKQKKSDKKIITFCSADIHILQHSFFSIISPKLNRHHQFYEAADYSCWGNIHSPPPCFN
jgi:hypothetical protein